MKYRGRRFRSLARPPGYYPNDGPHKIKPSLIAGLAVNHQGMMNRLTNMGHEIVAPSADMAKHRNHQVITKILVSAAIALVCGVAGAAPASAGPNVSSTDPNPFSGLSCDCQETAPAGSPALREEINRGIREGRTVSVPGLPAPAVIHVLTPK